MGWSVGRTVGGVRGDKSRDFTFFAHSRVVSNGSTMVVNLASPTPIVEEGVLNKNNSGLNVSFGTILGTRNYTVTLSRVAPTGSKVSPCAFGVLASVYLGT